MRVFGGQSEIYVRARMVLLDAIEALGKHRRAVVLVGAQAVYLHTGEGDLAVAPYTEDADLAIDPSALGDDPKLDELLAAAGFMRHSDPHRIGTWIGAGGVPIDLMVPERVGGRGRRGADLGPHGDRAARKARGLEAALVDWAAEPIHSLDPNDSRSFEIRVAGPTALLIAKLHKIGERRGSPQRSDDKDALDVYRLLQAVPTELLASRLAELLVNPLAGEVATEAVQLLKALFEQPDAQGVQMAVRATAGLQDPGILAASCAALAEDLLKAIHQIGSG